MFRVWVYALSIYLRPCLFFFFIVALSLSFSVRLLVPSSELHMICAENGSLAWHLDCIRCVYINFYHNRKIKYIYWKMHANCIIDQSMQFFFFFHATRFFTCCNTNKTHSLIEPNKRCLFDFRFRVWLWMPFSCVVAAVSLRAWHDVLRLVFEFCIKSSVTARVFFFSSHSLCVNSYGNGIFE